MTDVASHVLAPPFGLPGELDATLLEALRDERWGDAVTLLRDFTADPKDAAGGRRLLLLAYARFRDATEVMFDERLAASQEAHQLIERAVELGVDAASVAPLRDEVERTLDEETRAELAVLARLPDSGDLSGLPLELLLDAGHRLWSSEPARAAELFAAAAKLDEPVAAGKAQVRPKPEPIIPSPRTRGEGQGEGSGDVVHPSSAGALLPRTDQSADQVRREGSADDVHPSSAGALLPRTDRATDRGRDEASSDDVYPPGAGAFVPRTDRSADQGQSDASGIGEPRSGAGARLPRPEAAPGSTPLTLTGSASVIPDAPAAARERSARRLTNLVREGLCRAAAGQHAQAKPLLEAALTADWSFPALRDERHLAEDAVTVLLRQARGDDFAALWNLGDALGRASGLPFPSVWPNQEALLDRCAELRDWPRARALAARIEASREVLPRRLAARLQQVRLEQA